MAKCAICEKGVYFGNNVSHSHRRSNKMWKANVKSVRISTEKGNKEMYVWTSCRGGGKVERASTGAGSDWPPYLMRRLLVNQLASRKFSFIIPTTERATPMRILQ